MRVNFDIVSVEDSRGGFQGKIVVRRTKQEDRVVWSTENDLYDTKEIAEEVAYVHFVRIAEALFR